MESKRTRPSPPPPSAASSAESKVLDDDDLLSEIIVRLAFPTDLVCAALVCKRWLRQASDPAFLRRFRKLHPPRLLGFYVATISSTTHPQFVPMLPQPPELAAVCRRASFALDSFIWDCWNGSVAIISLAGSNPTSRVYSPLCPSRGMPVVPELPQLDDTGPGNRYTFEKLLFREGGGDGLPYLWLLMESTKLGYTVHVYMLRDGVWSKHTSAATQFPHLPSEPKPLLVDDKIYLLAALTKRNILLVDDTISTAAILSSILVLDLKDLSYFTIQLPEGVEYLDREAALSRRADDSEVYLIQLKDLKLRIWLHRGDGGITSDWALVDTICLREMFAALRTSDHSVGGEHTVLRIKEVGDNAEFMFLEMGRSILYLDIKCRTLCKVYDMAEHDQLLGHIYPFMMVWPPTFPALKDAASRNAEDGTKEEK